MNRAQLGVLIGPKSRGSNLFSIVDACNSGRINAEVRVVVSPNATSDAATESVSRGLNLAVVPPGDGYGQELLAALAGCDLICLAGFLRLLPDEVLAAFPSDVLNIHPALLPKFGGKGMYGHHVHEAVILAGESESGCTVHYVSERYDEGPILVQKRCAVEPGDTPETLAARVLKLEHEAYPEAIKRHLSKR